MPSTTHPSDFGEQRRAQAEVLEGLPEIAKTAPFDGDTRLALGGASG